MSLLLFRVFLFFYNIIIEAQSKNRINSFIDKNINTWNNQAINWKIDDKGDTLKELKVYVIGDRIPASKIDSLNNLLPGYNLEGMKLNIKQVDISADLKSDITREITSNILKGMGGEDVLDEKDLQIDSLKKEIDVFTADSIRINNALIDIRTFNSGLNELAYSEMVQRNVITEDSVIYRKMPTLLIRWNRGVRNSERRKSESEIYEYLVKEFKIDTLQIVNVR